MHQRTRRQTLWQQPIAIAICILSIVWNLWNTAEPKTGRSRGHWQGNAFQGSKSLWRYKFKRISVTMHQNAASYCNTDGLTENAFTLACSCLATFSSDSAAITGASCTFDFGVSLELSFSFLFKPKNVCKLINLSNCPYVNQYLLNAHQNNKQINAFLPKY